MEAGTSMKTAPRGAPPREALDWPAGPDLDRLVAQDVMGIEVVGFAVCVQDDRDAGVWHVRPDSSLDDWDQKAENRPVFKAYCHPTPSDTSCVPYEELGGIWAGNLVPVPRFSTSLEIAFEVLLDDEKSKFAMVRRLSSRIGEEFRLCRDYPAQWRWWLEYLLPGGLRKGPLARTAPLAICRAALECVWLGRT